MLRRLLIKNKLSRFFSIQKEKMIHSEAPETLNHPLEDLRKELQSSSMKLDLPTMRKMVYWKAGHLGINEVEILVKKYLDEKMEHMDIEQLWNFHENVVDRETDFLWRHLLGRGRVKPS